MERGHAIFSRGRRGLFAVFDCARQGAHSVTKRPMLRSMENNNPPIHESAPDKRVAYSPGEFAALFGKHQTWGYRQLYRGTVRAITQCGRILIPRSEVERLLSSAKTYDGNVQPARIGRSVSGR